MPAAVFTKSYLLTDLLRISLIKKKSDKKLIQVQEQFLIINTGKDYI